MRSANAATVVTALGLATSAVAKTCVNLTIPVTISARTGIFNQIVPSTQVDVTGFAQNLTRQGSNYTEVALSGYNTTTGTYNLSASFCAPNNAGSSASNSSSSSSSSSSNGTYSELGGTNSSSSGNSSSTFSSSSTAVLQILTHGIGFDKTYWDLPFNGFNYSYVDTATDDQGYYTLSYDRLGIGNSSHGDPVNEIQASLEVAALAALTNAVRNGSVAGINTTFKAITHVGHSFGSQQTYTLVSMYPNISDGIVLTGFSMNGSFVGYFGAGADFTSANTNQPFRFGNVSLTAATSLLGMTPLADYAAGLTVSQPSYNYPDGYLTNSNGGANQYLFLLPPYFDPAIGVFGEATKQPVTLGELFTLGTAPMVNSFAGPVLIITGSADLPYCGGDCTATGNASLASIPASAQQNFPHVDPSNFTAYIQPNTGHGINFHYNATGAYGVIGNFLKSKGLSS